MNNTRVGVAVRILHEQGDGKIETLLMLRKGGSSPGTWGFPGGSCDPGESPHKTALRECEEETGWAPSSLLFDGVAFNMIEGQGWVTFFFNAFVSSEPPVQIREPHKCERMEWFDLEGLPDNLFEPITADTFYDEDWQHRDKRDLLRRIRERGSGV